MCNCIRHNAFNQVKQMCLCEQSKVRLKTLRGPVPSVKDSDTNTLTHVFIFFSA